MGGLVDHLDSKNLVPFRKRRNGYHLPGLMKEASEQIIDEVDPELRPEEQSFVRHFLGYADVMLKNAEEQEETHPQQSGLDEIEEKRTGLPQEQESTPQGQQMQEETSIQEGKVIKLPGREAAAEAHKNDAA